MSKQPMRMSEQIRQAVDECGLSRYAICKRLGIDQGQFSRFMRGKASLGMRNLDALTGLLDLHLVKRETNGSDHDGKA